MADPAIDSRVVGGKDESHDWQYVVGERLDGRMAGICGSEMFERANILSPTVNNISCSARSHRAVSWIYCNGNLIPKASSSGISIWNIIVTFLKR